MIAAAISTTVVAMKPRNHSREFSPNSRAVDFTPISASSSLS
ncbi:MAG: hypothetical protein ACD_54C00872G0001 [uncultured bacterium]|nr:MAG: hypothetical protein ACD_54C00872G0001 [uncultured bacterium]